MIESHIYESFGSLAFFIFEFFLHSQVFVLPGGKGGGVLLKIKKRVGTIV